MNREWLNDPKYSEVISGAKTLLIFAVLFIGVMVLFSMFENPTGIRSFTVLTGSMEPAVGTGSVIFTIKEDQYERGDIITFMPSGQINKQLDMTMTHRIIGVEESDDGIFYTTKGDANTAKDYEKIEQSDVIGAKIFHIPYMGFIIDVARKPAGFMFLVVVPATLLIFDELKKIRLSITDLKNKNRDPHLH